MYVSLIETVDASEWMTTLCEEHNIFGHVLIL